MSSPVHSVALWSLPFTSSTFVTGPTVPAGFVWVVRDIALVNFKQPYFALGFYAIGTNVRGFVFLRGNGQDRGGRDYQWRGRFVMEPGDQIWFEASDTGFEGVVSGYQLTLP